MNRFIRPGRKIKTKLEGCLTFFKRCDWREQGHAVLLTIIKNSIISELSYTMLPGGNSWAWWGQTKPTETLEFGAEKGLLQSHARRRWLMLPPKSWTLWRVSRKHFLKARWGSGVVGCRKLLSVGILCFCRYSQRSDRNFPIKL